jgi:hypothetical protein
MRKIALLGAFVAFTSSMFAQAVLTVTATPTMGTLGYVEEQTYTFNFVTNASYTQNGGDFYFANNFDSWTNYSSSNSPIFSAITGTDLGGTYVISANPVNNGLQIGQTYFSLILQQNTGMGLTTPDGKTIQLFNLMFGTTDVNALTYDGTFISPSDQLLNLPGTLSWTSAPYFTLSAANQSVNFTVNSVTISDASATPVPEPSTVAAILGTAALGFAWCYRRRQQRA